MLDNKEKLLTIDYCRKKGLCDEGIESFIKRYKLKDEMFLGRLVKRKRIEYMLDSSYFLYIILKICNII
jgi:hypothetical protein